MGLHTLDDDPSETGTGDPEAADLFGEDIEGEDEEDDGQNLGGGEGGEGRGGDEQQASGVAAGDLDASDSEDEGEDVPAYENDGFVVDEDDEDGDEEEFQGNALLDSDDDVHAEETKSRTVEGKKKRKRHKKDFQLDDDDWRLLEEAGEHFPRPAQNRKRRFQRRGAEEASEVPADASQLQNHLFGDDYGGEALEDELGDEDREDLYHADEPVDDDIDRDGLDDFIVRDTGENEMGRSRGHSMYSGQSDRAVQIVASIFGDYEQLVEIFEKAQQEKQEGMDVDPENEAQGREIHSNSKAKNKLDPEELKLHGMLPEDDRVRNTDIPERFQQRFSLEPKVMDYGKAAQWIYDNVFSEGSQMRLELFIVRMGKREVDGPTEHEMYVGRSDVPCTGHRVLCERDDEGPTAGAPELQKAIQNTLEHIFKKHEEVPYIGTYCKHVCGDLLCLQREETPVVTSEDEYMKHSSDGIPWFPPGAIQAKNEILRDWLLLWAVYEWGLKWRRFAYRMEKRAEVYEKALDDIQDAVLQTKIQWCIDNVREASSMEDIDDIDQMFDIVVGRADCPRTRSTKKRSSRISDYARYDGLGLSEILGELGMKHRLFDNGVEPVRSEHWQVDVNDFVSYFKRGGGLESVENVLAAARQMAATELACTPTVRRLLREVYMKHAVVTTNPTDTGEEALDPFHIYGKTKRLINKPIVTFDDSDLYLRIVGASNDGLIKYSFGIPQNVFEKQVLKELKSEILLEADDINPDWIHFRESIVKDLALSHVFPSLEREFKHRLSEGAREFVKQQMAKTLWNYATRSPFKATTSGEDGEEEMVEATRVCACCWGPGQPSTVLVMLDAHGQLIDVLHVRQFSGEVPRPIWGETEPVDVFEDDRKAQDAAQVRDFLMEHKPHVIAVGATNLSCRQLLADMKSIRDHFLSEHARFMVSIQGNMEVVFAQESVAVLWENSDAAKAELPDHLGIVRRAVALGRTLIDPLAVLASLRDNNDTILSLHLYDMQRMLNREEKLNTIDQVMTTAICQMGVELNVMANVSWRAPSLQFVAGLGPRKAQGLLNALQRNGNRVESRWELLQLDVLGRRVAKNSCGFLRINSASLKGLDNLDFDMLDDSRIHPEHYELAKHMAMSVTGEDSEEMALKTVMMRPREMEAFDLSEFLSHLMMEGKEDYHMSTLIDIQMEFLALFHDRREGYQIPKDTDVFYWLANETPQVLKLGYLTEATVRRVEAEEVLCVLNNTKLDATIKRENISGSVDAQMDLKSRVRPGMVVHARLKLIEFKNFSVELTCRSNDLAATIYWEKCYYSEDKSVAAYYHYMTEKDILEEKNAKAKKITRLFVPRGISHPLFKNISMADTALELQSKQPGECILRPSPKSCNFICLSIKLFNGQNKSGGAVIEHRDLHEGDKGRGKGAHLKLGLPLTMKLTSNFSMTFDDLDEVIAGFVEPYMKKISEVLGHRKFDSREEDEIKQRLREEKSQVPKEQAVYCIGVDYKMAGWFYIGSVLSTSFNQERFSVLPEGIYYRRTVYKSVDAIIHAFKMKPAIPKEQRATPSISNHNAGNQGRTPQRTGHGGFGANRSHGNQFMNQWTSAPPAHGFSTNPNNFRSNQNGSSFQQGGSKSPYGGAGGRFGTTFSQQGGAPNNAGGLGSNRGWGAGPNPKTSGSGWNSSGPSGATWGNTNANANAAAGNWGSLPDTSTSGARWTSGPSKAASSGGWNTRPGDSGKSGWNSESSRQGNSGWGQAPSKVSDSGWGSAHPKQDNSSGWESAPPRPPPDEGWNSRSSNAWTSQETKPSSGGMGLSAGPNKQVNTGWGSVEPQLVSQSRGSWDSRPKEPKRRGWGSSPKASVPPPQPPSQPPESLGFTKGDSSEATGAVSQGQKDSKWEMDEASPRAPQNDSDSDSGTRAKRKATDAPSNKAADVSAPEGTSMETTGGGQSTGPQSSVPAEKPNNDSSSDSGMKF